MMRQYLTLSLVALLAACGDGQPFDFTDGDESADADTSEDNYYADDLNEDLTMNALIYNEGDPNDPTDDTLTVNNLPFDGSDIDEGAYDKTTATAGSYDVYESVGAGQGGDRTYFAVFRRTSNSQVAAVGTGDYIGFGFGGATAQRLGNTNLPSDGEYTYTGEYAAVRITTADGGTDDVEFVSGDVTMNVDIADFDETGAVEGIIDDRILYDNTGTQIGTIDGYISLATAQIDFENEATLSSTAIAIENGEEIAIGNWQAVFTGPDGEEIAGFLVIEGTESDDPNSDEMRETGVFIAFD